MLELTSQILGANPDFATLWNCRREVLQQLETQKCVVVEVPALGPPGCCPVGGMELLGHRDGMLGVGQGNQMQEGKEKLRLGDRKL